MMRQPAQVRRIEPRWPVALTFFMVLGLLAVLPERIKIYPVWFPPLAAIIILASMLTVRLSRAKAQWLQVERVVVLLFFVVLEAGILAGLASLIREMVNQTEAIGGLELLASSIAVWVTNVLTFSLLYWQLDRGGPETRLNNERTRPDWLFPQAEEVEERQPNWRPTFVDYLFLAFTTAAAFSPTDSLPLTARAKMLMMFESSISLTTIVVVVSRAINILGS